VRANALSTGRVRIGGRRIDIRKARGHVLVAMAERDNVIPLAAAEPLTRLAGHASRRETLRLRGGHVTFGTGREAFGHTLPTLSQWIAAHSDVHPRARRR
jgi:polyhydroxyalkanoate synthase